MPLAISPGGGEHLVWGLPEGRLQGMCSEETGHLQLAEKLISLGAMLAFHPPTQIHAPGKKLSPERPSKTTKLPLTIQRPVAKATPLGPQACRGRMDPHLSACAFRKLPPRLTERKCRGFAPVHPPKPTPRLARWRPRLRSRERGALTPCLLADPAPGTPDL